MNKKVSFIIAVFIALISVVLVSTFGIIPESQRVKIYMTDLYFNVTPKLNSENVMEKSYTMNFKANNNTLDMDSFVVYAPYDTTNIGLQFSTDQSTDKVTISSTGMLTIYDLTLQSFEVTVSSMDGSNLSDKIVIKKTSFNEQHFEDDDWWG